MADRWFYRMFGEDFGPVTFDKLKELTECGTLSPSDEVRSEDSETWVSASAVGKLGLENGFDTEPSLAAGTDFDIQISRSTNDDWYCMLGGTEFGPWSFEELAKYAESEQLSADDEVKLGESGKWRRVGSIGRLMALLPYKAVEKNIVRTAPKPVVIQEIEEEEAVEEEEFELPPIRNEEPSTSSRATAPVAVPTPVVNAPAVAPVNTQAAFNAAYEQAKAKIAESMMAQADAAFKAAEDQAKSHVAWATAPNVDKQWFGWAGGVEFGPVEFNQVFGLAKSGQLKPTDFVRNGQFAQFAPSSNIPGLFTAVAMIAKATETLNLAKSQAQAAASLAAPAPVMPVELLNSAPAPVVVPQPIVPAQTVAPVSMTRSNAAIPTISPGTPKSNPSLPTVRSRLTDPDPGYSNTDLGMNDDPMPSRAEASSSQMESRVGLSSGSPYSSSMSGGFSSSSSSMASMSGMSGMSSSSYAASRPVIPPKAYPKKPRASSSSSDSAWLSDMKEHLKEPKAIGALCAIAFIGLLFGWQYLPKSRGADIKKYQAMKQMLDEIRTKRTSAPTELAALKQKLTQIGKDITAELKSKASRDEPAKQSLLWAARDEVPRFLKTMEMADSPGEKGLEARLKDASYDLGLEKRPPVDAAALQLAKSADPD